MVGARAPGTELSFLTRTKRRKMAFFEGWPGGRRPRALVAGEGWGGRRGWMAVPKKGEGWGLVGCSKEGQVQGRVGLLGRCKGFGSGRVGVLFFESWRVDLVTCSRRGLRRAVWGSGKGWLRFRRGRW